MTPQNNSLSKQNSAPPAQKPATLIEVVRSMQGQIMAAVNGNSPQERSRRAERFSRIVVTALQKDPKLRQCTFESFIGSMMVCAQLNLEPNTPQQLAHLIPYNNKGKLECQFQPGYPGLMELAYRTNKVSSFHADVVYRKELEARLFKYTKGLKPNIEHKIDLLGDEREGELVAAYAVATMKDGSQVFRLIDKKDIERAKKTSAGARSDYSPWNTSPEAMWMKTAIKRLCSLLPRTEDLSLAVELDDKAERGEQQWLETNEDGLVPSLDDVLAAEIIEGEAVEIPPSKAETIENLSAECWDICNQKKLPMDDLLAEMFPKTKKDKLTLKDWQDFRGTFK